MPPQTIQSLQQQNGGQNAPLFNIQGRNGYDDPFIVPQNQCCEALNSDFYSSALGRRRGGAKNYAVTGIAPASGFRFLFRHVPGSDQTQAEFWAVDGTGAMFRQTPGTYPNWQAVALDDAITGNYGEVNAVSFNGKLFLCYQSGQNRLHVWDSTLNLVRRVGIATQAAAPTVANTGAGAYAATIRYYKTASAVQVGGVTTRRSELSAVVSFTPSGGGTAARVTRPTAVNEHETHWELYASADNLNFWLIATTAIGTTTFDDSTAPASYSSVTGSAAPTAGANLPPPAAKYIVADTSKMVMGGCWETSGGYVTPSNNQIWWTSNLGSSNVGDDERVSINSSITARDDIGEAVTGISKPQQGSFYLYSYENQYKYVSTSSVSSPYQRFLVAGGQGAISHKTIVVAHDDGGYPATYWMSKRGQERAGRYGNQFVGVDMTDVWNGDTQKGLVGVNLDATTNGFAVYHQDLHQIWTWLAETGSNTPTVRLVYDTWLGKVVDVLREGAVRGGWTIHTGAQVSAYCATMFSDAPGASMGRRLKPYIGYTGAVQVWKCDTTDPDDAGNTFQAYIESRPMAPWGLGRLGGVTEESMLICKADPGVKIQLTILKDEGANNTQSICDMSPVSDSAAETRVFPQFDASVFGDAFAIRVRLGDAQAVSATQWSLTAFIIPVQDQGER